MSPELGVEVSKGDNIELNVPYEIINVESDVVTEVRALSGVRVGLLTAKAIEGSVMCWKRPITGAGSKLGVLITLLGSNTDKWLHKWIIFKSWTQSARVVELTTAPAEKAKKSTTATLDKIVKKKA